MEPSFYKGTVFHKRFAPKAHELKYQVFTLFGELDELPKLAEKNNFFSFNKFNLISFWEKDFGSSETQSGQSLKEKLCDLLHKHGLGKGTVDKIYVLTYPRIFGFVFNPLTIFYCLDKNKNHVALIYEVRNTFGEKHNYIYKVSGDASFETPHQGNKKFHVSPFFDREGEYRFRVNFPDQRAKIKIDYSHMGAKRLLAYFSGQKTEIKDKTILRLAGQYPFMTLKVMLGILFEAFLLWVKGLKIFSHPEKHPYQSTEIFCIEKVNNSSKETL